MKDCTWTNPTTPFTSCLPSWVSAVASSGTPFTTVTPLPLRPLVSSDTRTMPSVGGGAAAAVLQVHWARGKRQVGHMRPDSVE